MRIRRSARSLLGTALMVSALVLACGREAETPESATAPAVAEPAADEPAETAPEVSPQPAGDQAAPATAPAEQPISPLPTTDEYAPTTATGAVRGVPAPTNTAPIVAVANYFADLPGIDMSDLNAAQREKFLHRANSELCTCGCRNDTIARCYVNDPTCTVVRGLVLSMLDEVRSGK